ncbi:hypothetical protein C2S51_031452 [Perilla frutescens var. frutescens]|nr:hypothetical protein C2S51_031452 [Perilla frutescens var. frutescens]
MVSSTIRAILFLVISLYLVVSKCNGEGYKPAPNCAKNECPSYTVVHTQKEFEIRSYKDAQWLSSPKIPSISYKPAASKGFLMLLAYIKGENLENVKINMTSPVLVGVQDSAYTVYFYLPENYQNKAPKPVMDEIKAVKLPEHKYAAVRRFDGLINDTTISTHVDALKKSLQSTPYQRAAAGCAGFTVAAYNAPFDLINRVNEIIVWFD